MSAQLQIYKCITLNCPYRNKGIPKEHVSMASVGKPKKKTKQNKDKPTDETE